VIFRTARRVSELEEDLAATMREVKSMRVEWDETYEKLLKLYRKTAAERAKLEKQETPPEEPEVAALEPGNGNSAFGSHLSPKQKAIQQQILRRRANL